MGWRGSGGGMLSFPLRPSGKTETKTASARRQKGGRQEQQTSVGTYLTLPSTEYMKDGSQDNLSWKAGRCKRGKYGYLHLSFPLLSLNTYTPYTHATALISSAAFWAMQQNEEQHLASSVLSTSVNGSNNNTTFAAVLRLPVLAKPKLRQRPISHVHSASRIREGYGQDGAQPRNDHRHKRVRGVTSKLSLSTQ